MSHNIWIGRTRHMTMFPFVFLKMLMISFMISSLCIAAEAASIAVSPSDLSFEIFRGEAAERVLFISNPGETEISYVISLSEHDDWAWFSERSGRLAPRETKEIGVLIEPDIEAPNGVYDLLVQVTFFENAEPGSVQLEVRSSVKARLEITGKQVVGISVGSLVVRDSMQGTEADAIISVSNTGNVKLHPVAKMRLLRNGRLLASGEHMLKELLPGSDSSQSLNFSLDGIGPGTYNMETELWLGKELVYQAAPELTILEYGSLPQSGVIVNLNHSIVGDMEGQSLIVSTSYQNTGEVLSKITIRQELVCDGTLVAARESEPILARPDELIRSDAMLEASFRGNDKPESCTLLVTAMSYGKTLDERQVMIDLSGNTEKEEDMPLNAGMVTASAAMAGIAIVFRKKIVKGVKKMVEKTTGKKTASAKPKLSLRADGNAGKNNEDMEKVYYCIDCGREIRHKGRCLPCNKTARMRLDAQDRKYE